MWFSIIYMSKIYILSVFSKTRLGHGSKAVLKKIWAKANQKGELTFNYLFNADLTSKIIIKFAWY